MNKIQELINETDADVSKAYELYDQYREERKPENAMFNLGRAKALETLILKLTLLLSDKHTGAITESAHFANTMLGEVPQVGHSDISEYSQADSSETSVVGQNEQLQKVCFQRKCFFQREGLCKQRMYVYNNCDMKQTE